MSSDRAPALVPEDDFEAVFAHMKATGAPYWADPARRPWEINHHDGGSGVYFEDPDWHLLEVTMLPYGRG